MIFNIWNVSKSGGSFWSRDVGLEFRRSLLEASSYSALRLLLVSLLLGYLVYNGKRNEITRSWSPFPLSLVFGIISLATLIYIFCKLSPMVSSLLLNPFFWLMLNQHQIIYSAPYPVIISISGCTVLSLLLPLRVFHRTPPPPGRKPAFRRRPFLYNPSCL